MRCHVSEIKNFLLLAQCKAYHSLEDTSKEIENLLKIQAHEAFTIHVSLPYSFLGHLITTFNDKRLNLGAETLLDADEGCFTATISGKMALESKAQFVLIGTPQDRFFHSTGSHQLKNKLKSALENNIMPFICIGETLNEHQDRKAKEILKAQLKDSVEDISNEMLKKLYIVYNAEWISSAPWAATSSDLKEAYQTFREVVTETFEPGTISHEQLIVAVPAYSKDLHELINILKEIPDPFGGYSMGILGLSSEFLQPLIIQSNEVGMPKAEQVPDNTEFTPEDEKQLPDHS